MKNRSTFEEKYNDFLRDTGRMTIEELTVTHFEMDIQSREFWKNAMDVVRSDIQQFLSLTK